MKSFYAAYSIKSIFFYGFLITLFGMYVFHPGDMTAQTVEASTGVGSRALLIELESLHLTEKENNLTTSSWSLPSATIRYGISDRIEFQFNMPFVDERQYVDERLIDAQRILDNAQLGLSVNLWEQNRFLPEAAIMYRTLVPLNREIYEDIGHLISLNFSNSLSKKLSLNYNLGCLLEAEANIGYYIANLSYDINNRLHCFSEIFGDFDLNGMSKQCLNFGFGYNCTNALTVDFSIANGLNHEMQYYGGIIAYQFDL